MFQINLITEQIESGDVNHIGTEKREHPHQCLRSSFCFPFPSPVKLSERRMKELTRAEKDASADLESLVILVHSLHVGF